MIPPKDNLNTQRRGCAIFPGSFDPLTNGHIDIVRRAVKIFPSVIVAVLENPAKKTLFSLEERVSFTTKAFADLGPEVQVESFSGLLVEFVRSKKTNVIVRGLRAISDYDYEAQIALMNRHLSNEVETLFLMSREEYSYISSTLVREVSLLGGSISRFVPPVVEQALREKVESLKK